MFVRNFEGVVVEIIRESFLNDKEFYKYLWKIKYNISSLNPQISFNAKLINYIKGDNFFI